MRLFTSKYCELALGARTFIHSGRRGRSAHGKRLSIATSLETVVPEAPLERDRERAACPAGEGWFVVNARDTALVRERARPLHDVRQRRARASTQVGFNIGILRPGEPNCMYHARGCAGGLPRPRRRVPADRRGRGATLKAWDFVHCPPMDRARLRRGRRRPCVVVGSRARAGRAAGSGYPVNETALKYGAGVEEETSEPSVAYARFAEDRPIPCPEEFPRLISRSARS